MTNLEEVPTPAPTPTTPDDSATFPDVNQSAVWLALLGFGGLILGAILYAIGNSMSEESGGSGSAGIGQMAFGITTMQLGVVAVFLWLVVRAINWQLQRLEGHQPARGGN